MKKLFINNKKQLRSGWKLAILTVIASVFMCIFAATFEKINITDKYGVTIFISFILSVIIMVKFIDKKRLNYIGMKFSKSFYKDLFLGLLLGAVLVTSNVIILLLLGKASFVSTVPNSDITNSLLEGLLLFILVGFAEELFFRGYLIMTLQQMGRWWLSILGSAIIFALLHGGLNDNVTYLGVLNILLAAILLGYIFVKTQSIWMCVGLHITWNYFQGYIFGVEVSGRSLGEGLYMLESKDTLMTGGAFGLEGGLANTIVLVIALILLWFSFKKKNRQQNTVEISD